MFLDEARIASQIHHGNVVQVLDVVEHEGLPCIVMEYLHGRSFATVLQRAHECGRPLPRALRLAVLAATAAGLRAAHAACGRDGLPLGVVHRDVSPQNVHVGFDGQIKVVDFGIAAARGRVSSTRSGQLKGKLEYLAPEQILAASNVGSSADVWSFGVMAWQTLGDAKLFGDASDAATMWNVVHREVPELRSSGEPLPDEIVRVVMGCLVREPDQRIALDACERVLARAAAAGEEDLAGTLARTMGELFADEKQVEQTELEHTIALARSQVRIEAPSNEAPRRRSRIARPAIAATLGLVVVGAIAAPLASRARVDERVAPAEIEEPARAPEAAPIEATDIAPAVNAPPAIAPVSAQRMPAATDADVAMKSPPRPKPSRKQSPKKTAAPAPKPDTPLFASPYGNRPK
ncbi:MAG TPA: protein kinase, partial [Nannocystaceae bacterium]|nr:protein kinase [Nannocystaceae bacterium]